jgi:biotin carboxylase
MAKRILILGAGIMQGPAIRLAKARGLQTVVVDGDASAPCAGEADRFERIDLRDKEGLEAFARTLVADGGLAGVMTAGTDFSASVAWVAERLGLPGIPHEAALDASDKARMRTRFREAGVPSPAFVILSSLPTGPAEIPFEFPVVVKPVDNMGSRGCRRVDTDDDFAPAVEDALRFSRSGRVIVEEYMEGPEFSVDALVHGGRITICGLADRHIFFPPYFIEMGHTMPTSIDEAAAAELLFVFEQGVRALGITDGAAKGDVKLTSSGPMIGEIAARLSGGYMSGWTYPYASGVEPTAGAIAIAIGEAPTGLVPKRNWTCAERAFISIPGEVSSIEGLEAARSVAGVKDLFLRVSAGSRVAFPENNVSKCGNIIAAAPQRVDAVSAAERAARTVLIRLSSPNADTEAFLSDASQGVQSFPPSAFTLSTSLRAELGKLDDPEPTAAEGRLALLSFPALESSGLIDFVGRSVQESLDAVRRLTGLELRIVPTAAAVPPGMVIGRRFWTAFCRGGYQGGAYVLDSLRSMGGR